MSTTDTRIPLADRMKGQYEDRTRYFLPRRTYTVVRIDGRAFHTYTRAAERPFDYGLMDALDTAAVGVCGEMMGCCCAYGQSDEYSFLLTDFNTIHTQAWFDGNIQKIVSVAASTFTKHFPLRGASFDARVFTVADPVEVENYFIWRQQDATRNAIQMAGYAKFSPAQMHKLGTDQVQEKLFRECGINFNDYPVRAKRGRTIWKETYTVAEPNVSDGSNIRTRWVVDNEMPVLTADRGYFKTRLLVPRMGEE